MVRRLRPGWRWCWLLSFGLLCVYIAFDALDVDGSDFHIGLGQTLISAASDAEALDRVCRGDLAPSVSIAAPSIIAPTRCGGVEIQGRHFRRYRLCFPRRTLSTLLPPDPSIDPA